MSEYESDFTSENPDDTSRDGSHPPRTNRHGSPVKPGQRGRGKRELGEKPLVTVKWDEPMTNQLWQMIKDDLELRPVLATETTKSLVTPTKSSMTYSKKDLQRRIAEILWKDTHDINDLQILENLTRAVKNKIHKTYLLYDQVIKGLGPEFIHYNSEIDVPPEAQSKWAKAKERFPTFFAFQTLKQEYEESERRAGSTPNGPLQSPYHNTLLLKHLAQNPHFLSLAQRGEGLAEMPADFGLGFEVVPPPADLLSDLSDGGEPVHRPSANHPNRSPSHSPFAQPVPLINPHNRRHLDASGRTCPAPGHASKQSSTGSTFSFPSVSVSQTTSPLQDSVLLLPDNPPSSLRQPTDGASSQTRVVFSTEPAAQSYPVVGADRRVQSPLLGAMISASPTALPASPSGLGFTHNLENLNLSPYRSTDALAPATQTSVILPLLRRTARRPKDPLSASNSAIGHSSGNATSKSATFSPQQPQHASINRLTTGVGAPKSPLSSSQALAVRPGTGGSHQRSHSDSMDASSTFSEQREFSQSPSPPLPDRDSPPLTTALESLIDMHREKEVQKRKREEMWVEHKRKRYEDRQRQREENERQRLENERHRQENERQRQHQEKMMEMKLQLAKLSAAKEKARAEGKQAQSQAKLSPGSGTGGNSRVPLPGSTITSPTSLPPSLNGADVSSVKSPANTSRSLGSTSGDTAVAADRSGGGSESLGLSLEVDHMSQQQYPSPSSITGGYPGLPFTNIEQSNPLQNRTSLLQPKYPSIQQQLSRQYAPHAQHQQAYLPQRPPVQISPSQAQGASAMGTPASISLGSMDLTLPYEDFSLTGYNNYTMSSLPQQHTPSQQQHLSLASQPYQSPAMHQHMQSQAQMHQQPQGQFMLELDGSHPTFDMFSDPLLMILPPSEHQHPSSQEQAPHHQSTYYHG